MPYLCVPSKHLTPGTEADLPEHMGKIRRAIDAAIRRHPGGYAEVARQLGQTEKYLTASVENLQSDGNTRSNAKLGLVDSQRIADITGDGGWVREMAHFHGFELAALPAPTCDSMQPEDHVTNAIHSLGLYLAILTASDLSESTFKAMESVRQWATLAVELAPLNSISLNQRRALDGANLDIALQPMHCPFGTVALQFWLQLVADARQATKLLTIRYSALDGA